jgi:hypothetical protein
MKKLILIIFALIPILSSTVSAIHLESFLRLSNPIYLSITIALAYELANLTIVLVVVNVKETNKLILYSAFMILIFMQILGNVYFSYDSLVNNGGSVRFREILDFISIEADQKSSDFILSCIIGIPIPLVSLLLTKLVSDMLENNKFSSKEEVKDLTLIDKTESNKAAPLNIIVNDNISNN